MKSKLIPVVLALSLASIARADFDPIPLTPGSYSRDVVVEAGATKPSQLLVTANMDAGTNLNGTVGGNGGNMGSLYEIGFGSTSGTGLPFHGFPFTAVADVNRTFRMPADYTANNALYFGSYGTIGTQVQGGTLTLATPTALSVISVLATAGNGPVVADYTVHYMDGSSDVGQISINDWFAQAAPQTNTTAWICNGAFRGSDGAYIQVNATPQQIRLYYNDIVLTSQTVPVTSIDFSFVSGGRAGIFGMSGSPDGFTFTPLAITGFNADMIIEAPLAKTITATVDGGTNMTGNTWYEQGFAINNPANINTGLPHPGTTFNALSNANYSFKMASSYTANNTLMINNQKPTGTFTFTTPATYSALSVLGSSGNGPVIMNYVVHHADASTETGSITNADWFNNTPTNVAFIAGGRTTISQNNVINNALTTTGTKVFYDNIPVTNVGSPVTSVDFTYVSGGRTTTFAVSGDATGSGTFSPIAVTGFNVDSIVEAFAVTNVNERFYTSATMDGGTNNNANTWYEQGWNTLAPLSGLPPANSTISSTNLPDHHYQFAPSYAGPNAIYADSNNPVANITFATPTNFTGLSFLSANANGGIQVQVILNHENGTFETNVFNSKDWFNGLPAAFTSAGRLNSDNRSANNWVPVSTNPRLYEAQFFVKDDASPITGATLRWTTNNGTGGTSSTTSRFVVMAVSGTHNAVAAIIGNNPVASTNWQGSNLVVSATITGGTAPLTYQWQAAPLAGGAYTNVLDGGNISGATSTNLMFTGIDTNNSANYRLSIMNAGGTSTTLSAPVQVFSSLPDITSPTDPISSFGGNTSGDGGAQNIIDDRLNTKYLNFGANGAAPFVGPIGFIVTPNTGSTILRGIRIYAANDSVQRDPIDYEIEGSNDGGNNWTLISSNNLALADSRNTAAIPPAPLTNTVQESIFPNSSGYTSYRVSFTNSKNNTTANSIQIAEVELLGTLTPLPPVVTRNPLSTITVYVGASATFSIAAGGPPPLTYQWISGVTAINNATNSAYTFSNAQLSDSGKKFKCRVTNPFGFADSSETTLIVIPAPTNLYPVAILTDNPIAFWRLDEGPDDGGGNNSLIANDYRGGHSGVYSNAYVQLDGYNPAADTNKAAQFGVFSPADSYVKGIQDIDFSTPTNFAVNFSLEAWVKGDPQMVDAGIITKGIGGGGEQFNLDTGGTGHPFRFFVRDVAGATHAVTSSKFPDGAWHHLVAVVDEANSNVVLYVDGLSAGTAAITPFSGLLSSVTPMQIGSRRTSTATDYNLQWTGLIDEVAIYDTALTSNKVYNHYLAAQPAPVFTLAPTNTTAGEGSIARFYASAYGPGPITYQWYDVTSGDPGTAIPNATNSVYSITNVTPGMSGKSYRVAATNPYGSATVPSVLTAVGAQLTVISGPPFIITDLPATQVVYAGRTAVLSVIAAGTAPLSYQWLSNGIPLVNGGRITGAQSNTLTITYSQPADSATYQVSITNAASGGFPTTSAMQQLVVVALPTFADNGFGWSLNGVAAKFTTNAFALAEAGAGSPSSSFFPFPQYVRAFIASFTYIDVGGGGADGAAFILQNDARGTAAIGGGGGQLGYQGIAPSAALEFNIYSPNGVGYNFRSDKSSPITGAPYIAPGSVNIASGNPIDVVVKYRGSNIELSMADATAGTSYSTSLPVGDLTSIVGAETAYIGFSGAYGGTLSTQYVYNFKYIPLPVLTARITGSNSLLLTWNANIGGYKLQSSTDLGSGVWTDVTANVNLVGGEFQVAVSPLSGNKFYRLVIAVP